MMSLDIFLAAMHDRMVPSSVRHTVDDVDADVRLE